MTGWAPRPPAGRTTARTATPAPHIQTAILATYRGWSYLWSGCGPSGGPSSIPVESRPGPGGPSTSLYNAYERKVGVEIGNYQDHPDHPGRAVLR